MTRLSLKQARQLGIITGHGSASSKAKHRQRKPSTAKKTALSLVQWDAKTFPGGVWLQVPFVPPSLNDWMNWHWGKQCKYKQELADAVWKLVMAMKLPRFRRATVQIIYYHSTNRRRDPADNWAPKFLMDALVQGGILQDDNGDLVKVSPVGMEFDPERPRTEVFIWEGR